MTVSLEKKGQRHRGNSGVIPEARVCFHKSRDTKDCQLDQELGQAGRTFPSNPWREHSPVTPKFQTCGFQNISVVLNH